MGDKPFEEQARAKLWEYDIDYEPKHFAFVRRVAGQYDKEVQTLREQAETIAIEELKKDLDHKADGVNVACRILKPQGARPLHAVKRTTVGPRGEKVGTITTTPAEVDREVRLEWGKVYGEKC